MAKKSDVFGFPVGKCAKIPISPILQYFGTRQVVVASEALLSPLTAGVWMLKGTENRCRKILHTRSTILKSDDGFSPFFFFLLCISSLVWVRQRTIWVDGHLHIPVKIRKKLPMVSVPHRKSRNVTERSHCGVCHIVQRCGIMQWWISLGLASLFFPCSRCRSA